MISGDPEVVRAKLQAHGAARVIVSTGSMAPTLEPGDSVMVHGPVDQPRAGDVALLASGSLLTLHRLIGRIALGGYARWVHAGDAPGAAAGLCRADEVLAIAELPRKLPAVHARARLHAIALARALVARLSRPAAVAVAALLVLAPLAGCKPKPPPPTPPARIVEVRVTDRTPAPGAPLDTAALTTRAAQAIAESSGLDVKDGGIPGGALFKLRIEVRVQPGDDPDRHKPILQALVSVKLAPQDGAGLLAYEQTAVAVRDLDSKADGGVNAMSAALVERAVLDVVRGVGARVKLASADVKTLGGALDGADDDLRLEALRVAGERRERTLVPAVVRLLKSDDRDMRDRAVGTLASIGDPAAVKPLTEVARFRDLADLPMVLDALATIGGDEARAYLEFVSTGHDNAEMRELAKKALSYAERRARRDLGAAR